MRIQERKIDKVEKALKNDPYITIYYNDGSKDVKCGTICSFQALFKINRHQAIDLDLIDRIDQKNIILKTGEILNPSRRKLKKLHSQIHT